MSVECLTSIIAKNAPSLISVWYYRMLYNHADEIWNSTDMLQNFGWQSHLHLKRSRVFGCIGWKPYKRWVWLSSTSYNFHSHIIWDIKICICRTWVHWYNLWTKTHLEMLKERTFLFQSLNIRAWFLFQFYVQFEFFWNRNLSLYCCVSNLFFPQ